ncbi:MAG TPA: MFS transporter [Ilumatobacter sp.]|nr:MFS transporter [Ilumatobacter sp.]
MADVAVSVPVRHAQRPLVWGLAATQTVGYGVLFYALPVVLVPMRDDLGWSRTTIVGAYSLAILISGLLAPVVGRHVDRDRPRRMMVAGSAVATLLVVAWSQVGHPAVFYAIWIALGVAKSGVLYEAALPIVIKRSTPDHTRALLTVTLTAGLASLIFQPLTSRLTEAFGWRQAVLILAVIHGAVTVPVHWAVLTPGLPRARTSSRQPTPELRERRFWVLTAAFAAVTITGYAALVLLVSYLHDQGWSLGRAALAGGTVGLMQLPGRFLFSRVVGTVPNVILAPAMFVVPAVAVLALVAAGGSVFVWPAVVLLGIGQGAMTLLRATVYVDLFGTERIGAVSGASAVPLTVAAAVAPLGASALVASGAGYAVTFAVLAAISMAGAATARTALR